MHGELYTCNSVAWSENFLNQLKSKLKIVNVRDFYLKEQANDPSQRSLFGSKYPPFDPFLEKILLFRQKNGIITFFPSKDFASWCPKIRRDHLVLFKLPEKILIRKSLPYPFSKT